MGRFRWAAAAAAMIALAAAQVGLAAAEWPGWRGAKRDGKSPDTGLLKEWPADGPRLAWRVDSLGSGFSSVAVSGGRIYITGKEGNRLALYAFDMGGALQWKKHVDEAYSRSHPGARATPTIHEGHIYLLSGNGQIGCYTVDGGREVWTRHARDFGGSPGGWGYAESVLIYKDLTIFKPGGKNCIVALDKRTGRPKWATSGFKAGPEYSSCLAIPYSRGCLLVTGTRKGIVGVDADDGEVFFTDNWSAGNTANVPTPAYAQAHVFWANGYGKGGVCLRLRSSDDGVSATRAWTTKDMVCHHGGYIIHEGYIYGNHDGGWSCLELKSGRKMWFERAVGKGSLCWADGMLYLFGEKGGRAALATCSPQGMEVKGRVRVAGRGPSWAHPVVIGGRLYLRYDSNLYCFDVKAK